MLLRYRLGMPISPAGKCFQCDKRSSNSSFTLGDHALCCIRSGTVRRHYDIVHEMSSILSQGCCIVKPEYVVQISPELRADLAEAAYDVTIVQTPMEPQPWQSGNLRR